MEAEIVKKRKKKEVGTVVSVIHVNSLEFKKACEVPARAVNPKSIVAAMAHIKVQVADGVMELTGTNGHQVVIRQVEHENVLESALFLFPTTLGLKLLQSLPNMGITITHRTSVSKTMQGVVEVTKTAHSLDIDCAEGSYTLEVEDVSEFLKTPEMGDAEPIRVKLDELLDGLQKCKDTVGAPNAPNPAYTGVCLGFGNIMSVVSTDGHVIVRKQVDMEWKDGVDKIEIILPIEVVSMLMLMDSDEVEIRESGNMLDVRSGKTTVMSLTLNYRFPNIDRALPASYSSEITMELAEIKGVLSRAALFADSDMGTIKMELQGNKLQVVVASSVYSNESYEEVDVEDVIGEESQFIWVNVKLMNKLLSNVSKGLVTFKFNGDRKPMVMTFSEFKGLLMLISPIFPERL